MRARLAALLAVLVLSAGAVVATAAPALATTEPPFPGGTVSGPPDANGYYGWCNLNVTSPNFAASALTADWYFDCNYGNNLGVGTTGDLGWVARATGHPNQGLWGLNLTYGKSAGGTWSDNMLNGDPGGSGRYLTTYADTGFASFTTIEDTGSHFRGRWHLDGASTYFAGLNTAVNPILSIRGAGTSLFALNTTFTTSSAAATDPGRPTTYFTGFVPVVPCTVTWDTPTTGLGGPFLFAGTTITFSIHLDDLTRYVAVDVAARRISDEFGTATPAAPTPPTPDTNLYSAHSTALAHDMVMQVTPTQDGHYQYAYRCQTTTGGLTNEIGGTLTDVVAWPTDVVIHECIPVIGIETCGERPGLEDCIPTSSGGIFGIIGTVLDPNTYVRATVCMAEALFMPGPSTTAALQSLWTLAQSRAPFSYIHDAIVFLPSALTSFGSGLSGATGSCLINIPGAGCASIGTSSDLSLVRTVLLFLFVGLLTLAVIRTTMRVANGG